MSALTDRKAKIVAALTHLGDSADAVARALTARRITGERGDPAHCPIANYLAEEGLLDRTKSWEGVGGLFIHLYTPEQYELDTVPAVTMPTPVYDFVRTFDTVDPSPWPQLVAAESRAGTVAPPQAIDGEWEETRQLPAAPEPPKRTRTRTRTANGKPKAVTSSKEPTS